MYPVVYDPGYTREDTTVRVETNVYATSKPDGDLVWTGRQRLVQSKVGKEGSRWTRKRSPEADGERRVTIEKIRLKLKTSEFTSLLASSLLAWRGSRPALSRSKMRRATERSEMWSPRGCRGSWELGRTIDAVTWTQPEDGVEGGVSISG